MFDHIHLLLGFLAMLGIFLFTLYFLRRRAVVNNWGSFSGSPKVQLDEDGRTLTLLEDFGFYDPAGGAWVVPSGWIVDGASIPRPFWSFIGGPLEGRYRNASIIHDYYCDTHRNTWQETHEVFYKAMRAAGVSERQAKIMFAAVWIFGPRWALLSSSAVPSLDRSIDPSVTLGLFHDEGRDPHPEEVQYIAQRVQRENPSHEDIKKWRPA